MLLIPSRFVTLLSFEMSILATYISVVLSRLASSFQVGSSCWQCPHHFAYTSTSQTPELTWIWGRDVEASVHECASSVINISLDAKREFSSHIQRPVALIRTVARMCDG